MKDKNTSFWKRLKSMLAVDFRRMFTMKKFYIIAGICFIVPILILVMTTMMDGSVSVDPQTGVETVMHGFDSVWQLLGSVGNSASMDMTSMCNINLLYFALAIIVGLFVSEDFKSGYAKNIFTVRAKKSDYVISKTIVCIFAGTLMIVAFLIGIMLGGIFSGVSFALDTLTLNNIIMCIISKILLIAVFVPIYLAVSVGAKQKTWLSIVGSCAVGMLLFSMIPAITPPNATIINIVLCLAGGLLFSTIFGFISIFVLRKKDLI